jgi:hypothetical protein
MRRWEARYDLVYACVQDVTHSRPFRDCLPTLYVIFVYAGSDVRCCGRMRSNSQLPFSACLATYVSGPKRLFRAIQRITHWMTGSEEYMHASCLIHTLIHFYLKLREPLSV